MSRTSSFSALPRAACQHEIGLVTRSPCGLCTEFGCISAFAQEFKVTTQQGVGAIAAKKKRLTLDLDPPLQRRLKVVAALKGISMRRYCQTAIDKELARDEAQAVESLPFGREALDGLEVLRTEVFGDRVLPGDSAELFHEARRARSAL